MLKGILVLLIIASFFSWGCKEKEVDGGPVKIDVNSSEVKSSVEFLKKELLKKHPDVKIVKVVSAQSQVVAGQKIFLTCEYVSDINKKPKVLKAQVFITLEDKYILDRVDIKK